MQDLTVDQYSTWKGSALNHPYRGYPSYVASHQPDHLQDNYATCPTSPLPSTLNSAYKEKNMQRFCFILGGFSLRVT